MPKYTPRALSQNISDIPQFNVRAASYFVAYGRCRCWRCSDEIAVTALGVAPPFSLRVGADHWREGTRLAILSYIERLADSVANSLGEIAPYFFLDQSQWHQRPYWMNHCQQCGAKIGDYETIETAMAPFNVQRFEAWKNSLTVVSDNFEAATNPG